MKAVIAGMMVLAVCGTASAAITVTAGTHYLAPNTPGQTFDILISATEGERIAGCNVNVQVEDGTMGNGTFTAIIFPLFVGMPEGDFANGLPQFPAIGMNCIASPSADIDPVANGVLARVTIDTTGMAPGQYELKILDTLNGNTAVLTYFGGSTAGTTYLNGTIFVPEPAALSLLALGGLALMRRRRAA